jgi:two-component system LytT family sensor kinase
VENAVRHGNAEKAGRGAVTVRARREDSRLVLEVEDDGPGLSDRERDRQGTGVGLSGTAERLQLLYGDRQTFLATNRNGAGGGFLVRATLPLRRHEAATA